MLVFRNLIFFLSILPLLAGCASSLTSGSTTADQVKWLGFARDGMSFLEDGEFENASASFNNALKLNIRNARLQALNGITYHLSARNLDAVNYGLAEEGYKLSAKFDPSDWRTQYLLGLVKFEQQKFDAAKLHFIKAAVLNSSNDKIYYHLLAAAYYSMDFRLTLAVTDYLAGRNLPAPVKSGVYKTCALIGAALSRSQLAQGCLDRYRGLALSAGSTSRLADRMAVWKNLHQVAKDSSSTQIAGSSLLAQAKTNEKVISDTKMVIVDVVIIGSREDNRSKTGINILDGLAFQFGDVADGVDAFNYSQTKSRDSNDSANDSNVLSIIRTLTIPGISYSLNIINSADNQSKILAKPSLMALSGQKSVFFSGVNINAAASSGGTGDSISIEKEIGVRLEVTPEFLGPDKVRLEVKAERTFLTDPSSSVVFDYRLDTTKTLVTSFVALNMGETLVLGGLTEQEDTDILDGVPGLKNTAVVNLLFSEKIERRFKKSITILLTPRAPGTPPSTDTPFPGANPASLEDRNLMILYRNIGFDTKKLFPDDERTFEFKRSVGRQFIGPEDIVYKAENAEILETAKHLLGKLEGSI